jgi:Mg-chelatase subunit ChlD
VGGTNISAGMKTGRQDLQDNSRPGAFRMMVLMTDGIVNLPTGNTKKDKQAVIDEAYKCAEAKIPVVTIALGSGADAPLMQQVADITSGAAFVIPGGQPIADVREQLEEVFAQVAADRPLQLVK